MQRVKIKGEWVQQRVLQTIGLMLAKAMQATEGVLKSGTSQ